MHARIVLIASLLLAGCSFTLKKPPSANAPQGARITVGMLGGCNVLVPQARPVYPEEAKDKRIKGTVKLRAVIAKTGELRNIEVLEGDPLLVPAALTAVRQWRYAPCLMNSEPLEVVTPIDVNFNLNQ